MKMKHLFLLVLAAILMLSMVGCGKPSTSSASGGSSSVSDKQNPTIAKIKAKGVLVVGTASGYPPYEFVDVTSPSQDVVGIDMELAKAIAKKIGVKLEIQDMDFSALLTSLQAHKVDIAIAGISPTPERKKTVDFSEVYLNAEQKILIRKSDAGGLASLSDFGGKSIGAETASTQATLAQNEIKNAKLVTLEKTADLVLELNSKKIDGVVLENTVAQQYIISNPNLALSNATFQNKYKYSAVALSKGQSDLVKLINGVVDTNKQNGNITKWIKTYSELASKNASK